MEELEGTLDPDGNWKGRRVEGLDPDRDLKGHRLEGTLDPDGDWKGRLIQIGIGRDVNWKGLIQTLLLEGLDPVVVAGRVGSRRCC